MATPGQIQIYSPARQLPPGFVGRQPPAPVRATPRQQQAGRKAAPALAGRWSALNSYIQADTDKQIQARAEEAAKKAQKEAQDAAYEALPWYKKGLAAVLDNPVTQVAMAPAQLLSVPSKVVTFGLEQGVRHLPEGAREWLESPAQNTFGKNAVTEGFDAAVPLFTPWAGQDVDKVDADKRSFLNKIAPRSDYGSGSVYKDIDVPVLTGTRNLALDIGHDPLTYVAPGGSVLRPAVQGDDVLRALGRGEQLALPEAQKALMTSERAAADAAERAAVGLPTGTRTAEEEFARQAAGRGSAAAAFEQPLPAGRAARAERTIPMPRNLDERMNLASEWMTENPALYRQHAGEIGKGIKRGFETMSKAAKADLGVETGGYKMLGNWTIPLSERPAQAMAGLRGARRSKISDVLNRLPKEGGWDKARNWRVPKGLEPEYRKLRQQGVSPDEAEVALNKVFMRNQVEIGRNLMKGKANSYLKRSLRVLRSKYSDDEIRRLVSEAETTGDMNEINQLFADMRKAWESTTGRKMVSDIPAEVYVPHVMDSKWRRFMHKNPDDPFVDAFMKANGFTKDNLLEASHHVDKARQMRVPPGQASADFDIAGRKVTLKGNSIDDLNAAFSEAFPEWKGDFFSKDPGVIAESYLDSIARDAGAHYAEKQLSQTASPLAKVMRGDLLREYEDLQKYYSQEHYAQRVTDVTAKGYSGYNSVDDIAPRAAKPASAHFAGTEDELLTEKLARDVQGAGRQWRRQANADIDAVNEEARDAIANLREGWATGLKDAAKADNPRIKALGRQVEQYKDWVKGLHIGDITTDNADQLVKVLTRIDQTIDDLAKELTSTKRTWNGKITREGKKVDAELAKQLRELKQVRTDLEDRVAGVGTKLREEIEQRRAFINGDVAEKEAALAAKEATVPKPNPSDPDVINRAYETSGLKSHPEYEKMQGRYSEAIRALQSSREDGRLFTKGGTIRRSEQKLIDEVEMSRDALRRVGWDPAKDYEGGLVHNGTTPSGRNKYKTSTGWRVEPAPSKKEMKRVRETGPKYTRRMKSGVTIPGQYERREIPRWNVIDPEGNVVDTTDSFIAASDHAMTEHVKAIDPPQYFHGTTSRVPEFRDAGGNDPFNQLLGAGVYTTGDESVGIRYSIEKGRPDTFQPTNEVYRVEGPQGPKLDLDKRIDYGLREHLLDIYRRQIEPLNVNDELNDFLSPFVRSVDYGLGGETTGEEAITSFMGMLRSLVGDNAIDRDHANEMLMELNQMLRDDGYVAMTHTGGLRMGDKEHPVTIWLDPNKVEIKDVLHQKGTWREAKEELARQQSLIDNYDGPTESPPKFLDNPNVPQWMTVGGVRRPNLTPSTINPEYKKYIDWLDAQSRVRVIKDRLSSHGNLHPYEQAANWEKQKARYQVDVADATKEERAAVEQARAARDARAGQREAIVRAGPEVGSQVWPGEVTAPVREAQAALQAKAAEVPRPNSRQRTDVAKQLDEEEKRLNKLRYEGSMTPDEYSQRLEKATRAKDRQLDDLVVEQKAKTMSPYEIENRRARINTEYTRTIENLQTQFEARLDPEEYARRMAVVQDRRAKLKLGPKVRSEEATLAAREAARKRVALQQQAPGRVVNPEDFAEDVVKPSVGDVKAVKHGQGHFYLESPLDETAYWIDVDRASKQPKWDVLKEGDEEVRASFKSLREATEYVRDDMARPLAKTEAERAALPPMERAEYEAQQAALRRSERSQRGARTAAINRRPGAEDIIKADEWYKANVRAATAPEREQLARARAKLVPAPTQASPRYENPLGGLGPGEERFVEQIKTPPQPAAFETSAVSAETGQLVGIPPPMTEGQRVAYLESQLHPGTMDIQPGSDLAKQELDPLNKAREVEQKYEAEIPFKSAEAKERINKEFGEQRDERIGEISEQQRVYANMQKDLTERESLLRKRQELTDLRAKLMKTPKRARNEELLQIVEQLEGIAKANPLLDNQQLNAAESLLHTHKEALQRIERVERMKFQVKNLEDIAKKGDMPKVMRAVLNDNWEAMHKGLLQQGDIIIDKRLATAMQNLYEMSKEPGLFGRALNNFTNLFKTYATLSPGFQVRNIMSGMFMNTADGVALRTQMRGARLWREWEEKGVDWLERQPQMVQDAFTATFGSGAGGRVAEQGVAGKSDNWIMNKLSNNWATRKFQNAGEKVEGALRLGMALDSMQRGDSVAGAFRRIGRVHFNYAEVSAFDEQAKRLIPFWTFMSRNLPLQLQEIFSNPRLYAMYGHVKQNFEGDPIENTPEYWKGLGTWRLPFDVAGEPAFYQPDFGFTRMGQDAENIIDSVTGKNRLAFLNSINPAFAATADFAYGKDSFTGRQFGPNDYSKVSGPLGAVEKLLATVAGETNEAGQVSNNFQNYLRSINPLIDRTTRLAPSLVGGDSDPWRTGESWARFIGVPGRRLSPKQQENEALRKYYASLDERSRQRAMAREEAS